MEYWIHFSHFFINKKKEHKTEGVMKQNIFFSSLPFNLNKPHHKPGIFHSYFFYVKFYFLFQAVPTNNREHDTEGRPGEDIILLCSEDGDPLEATRWIRNGVSIVPGPKYALQGNRLTIRQAMRSDFGRYECFPENTLGFARNVVNLGFRGSFLQKYCFLQLIALLSKYLGNFTSLTCRQENTQSFLL